MSYLNSSGLVIIFFFCESNVVASFAYVYFPFLSPFRISDALEATGSVMLWCFWPCFRYAGLWIILGWGSIVFMFNIGESAYWYVLMLWLCTSSLFLLLTPLRLGRLLLTLFCSVTDSDSFLTGIAPSSVGIVNVLIKTKL